MSAETIAVVAAAVGLLAVLVPLILSLHGRLADRIETVHGSLSGELAEVRRDLRDLGERVARIEGALTGPLRLPANGPAAAREPVPAPTAPGT